MDRLKLILACAEAVWQPHLGDPTIGGLGLTVLYVLASGLFLRLLWVRRDWLAGERVLWGTATLVLVLMALNKQLDLQQTVIWVGRCVARQEGWFDQRLAFQRAFGMTMLVLGAAGAVAVLWVSRQALAGNRALVLGMGLLALFVGLQVARFEQLAGGLGQAVVGLKLHRILEGVALLVLISAARRRGRR